ncbi:unnamed protein product [Sphagnum troendelagicum]|uniref:Uncharacterized protein n=1 Tax=Sphagnum troendelagicum TaxID=128251 RepID=A0ABP0V785_9BRYO
MKAAECKDLREGLLHKDEKKVVEAVRSKYPWLQYVTLMAIRSQEQLIPPCSICSNPSSRPGSKFRNTFLQARELGAQTSRCQSEYMLRKKVG